MIIKTISRMIFTLLASVIVATIIMIGLYMIPIEPIKEHVNESSSIYGNGEYSYTNWANGQQYTMLSYWTESLMVNNAVTREGHPIWNAVINPHVEYENTDMSMNIVKYSNGEDGYIYAHYPRYWHGYLLYMIPSLLVMNVGELKIVGLFFQFFLTAILIYELSKIGLDIVLSFCVVALFINPVTAVLTFQEADIFVITIISMIIMLKKNKNLLENNSYCYFFMTIGIAVAFFDFLTYPLAALGIPLVLYYVINDTKLRKGVLDCIKYTASCFFGYVGMWGGKWIIAQIFTDYDVISDAINQVIYRSAGAVNGNNEKPTYINTIKRLLDVIDDKPMLLLLGITLAVVGIIIYRNNVKHTNADNEDITTWRFRKEKIVPIMMIGMYPFGWFLITMNHATIHPWLSYRNLSVTVWAALAIVTVSVNVKSYKADFKEEEVLDSARRSNMLINSSR